jgi:hypothetical protein
MVGNFGSMRRLKNIGCRVQLGVTLAGLAPFNKATTSGQQAVGDERNAVIEARVKIREVRRDFANLPQYLFGLGLGDEISKPRRAHRLHQ